MAWHDRWELQDSRRPGAWEAERRYAPWPTGGFGRESEDRYAQEREPWPEDARYGRHHDERMARHEEHRWREEGGDAREAREDGGHRRREIDPPWVEAGPRAREQGRTRGLYEWEDRGPLQWLGDKLKGNRPGRGPRGYQRSDERIRDEVCERLARSGLDVEDVEVTVENREVTLHGTVERREDKWRLEDVAEEVYGVEDVHVRLKPRHRPSDSTWGR